MAWLGLLGKEDPVVFGASLQEEKEIAGEGFPNPSSEYGWARNIKTVADWTNSKWHEARELASENPWLFNTLLGCANAEKDAEPIQIKTAQAAQEASDSHNDAASTGTV